MSKNFIQAEVVKSISDAIFQPSDWSVINIPHSEADAVNLLSNLYNSPVSNHVCLILCRHRRKFRLEALSNIRRAERDWHFLDTVTISYEKPSSCSNNGFLPISEVGFIVYKGTSPDTRQTKWFNDSLSNATTMWDLRRQEDEGKPAYFQKFSWEMNLLMLSLSSILESSRFVYGLPVKREEIRTIYNFCAKFGITAQLYVESQDEVQMINEECNKAASAHRRS
jgi:hypothetical protein